MSKIKHIIRFVYNYVKRIIISNIKLKNYIFFEAKPDFQDNSRPVFDEMVKRKWNNKYKIFWAVDNPENFSEVNINNVYFIKKGSKEWTKISRQSKVLVSCNFIFYKTVPRKDQLNIYLCHGATYKSCGNRVKLNDSIDYVNILSPYLKEDELRVYGVDENKFIYFGFPRNDIFYKRSKLDVHKIFPASDFKKLIVWMPTFRQNITGTRNYSSISQPIIHSEADAVKLNNYAKMKQVIIILKPHFNQNMKNIKKMRLDNLIIVDDSFFEKKKILMYEVLASSDAMITDYSSVFWDYLNAKKPIGLCWEDFDEFNEKNGFNVDITPIKESCEIINTMDDFYRFIDEILAGKDIKKEHRNALNQLVNGNAKGTSSKQIVDFIEKNL